MYSENRKSNCLSLHRQEEYAWDYQLRKEDELCRALAEDYLLANAPRI